MWKNLNLFLGNLYNEVLWDEVFHAEDVDFVTNLWERVSDYSTPFQWVTLEDELLKIWVDTSVESTANQVVAKILHEMYRLEHDQLWTIF